MVRVYCKVRHLLCKRQRAPLLRQTASWRLRYICTLCPAPRTPRKAWTRNPDGLTEEILNTVAQAPSVSSHVFNSFVCGVCKYESSLAQCLLQKCSLEVATATAKTLGAPSEKASRETARVVACAAAQLARAHGAGARVASVDLEGARGWCCASLRQVRCPSRGRGRRGGRGRGCGPGPPFRGEGNERHSQS